MGVGIGICGRTSSVESRKSEVRNRKEEAESVRIRTWAIAALTLVLVSGCRNTPPSRLDPLPQPSTADFRASALGKFVALLKTLPDAQRRPAVERFLLDHPIWPLIERDTLASFLWFGKARVVAINGDLQYGWSRPDTMASIPCDNDTLFIRMYSLPPDARLDYLFTVDGREMPDPRNPRITPSGFGPHSEVAMSKFKSNPLRQLRPNVPQGALDSLMFASKNDSLKPRQVRVYKPADYEHLSLLPSLYVHDGSEAMEYLDYPTVLDNLIADRKIEPVLVVFIPWVEGDMPYLFEKHREFSDAICGELVALIDGKYRTIARPERRAVAGISAWGQFAIMTALNRPDVFLCAAGQSSTLKEAPFDALREALNNRSHRPAYRIYFDVGRYDLTSGGMEGLTFLQANRQFHEEMEKYGLVHAYHEFNGGHQWADWRERTEEILVYFFGVKREPEHTTAHVDHERRPMSLTHPGPRRLELSVP